MEPLRKELKDAEMELEELNGKLANTNFTAAAIMEGINRVAESQRMTAIKDGIISYCLWIQAGNLGSGVQVNAYGVDYIAP